MRALMVPAIMMLAVALAALLGVAGAHPAFAGEPSPECAEGQAAFMLWDSRVCMSEAAAAFLEDLGLSIRLADDTHGNTNVWHPQVERDHDTTTGFTGSVGNSVRMAQPSMAATESMSDAADAALGLAVGGAQDIANFRANIVNGYLPLATDITPEGLFYDYYFDTGSDGTCAELFCPTYSKAASRDPLSGDVEAWLSVGLESGIRAAEFERPDLNLVIVLDVSGSMSGTLESYHYDNPGVRPTLEHTTKMAAANAAVAGLIDLLGPRDRLGIVLFDNAAHVARPLLPMDGADRHTLKENIMGIYPDGGTYMEGGIRAGTGLFSNDGVACDGQPTRAWHSWIVEDGRCVERLCNDDGQCVDIDEIRCVCPEEYGCAAAVGWCIHSVEDLHCVCPEGHDCPDERHWCVFENGYRRTTVDDGRANRIIFLTDAMPNVGDTSPGGLLHMVEANAKNGIHTTFVGMGLDFNTELVDAISKVHGANYYSVHSADEFNQRMVDEFDFMVTPLVYDLELSISSDDWAISRVYGSPDADRATGTILHVNTLFPSASVDGEVRGGIILIRLEDRCIVDCSSPIILRASYDTADGKSHAVESVVKPFTENAYDNDGIRKGVLLAKYADLMQSWIVYQRTEMSGMTEYMRHFDDYGGLTVREWPWLGHWERQSVPLAVTGPYHSIMPEFAAHFDTEMGIIGDHTLEMDSSILHRLVEVRMMPDTSG